MTNRFGAFRLLPAMLLAFLAVLHAQAPLINSVYNAASGDTRVSPGTLAVVRGENLFGTTGNNEAPLETPTVVVGGRQARVLGIPDWYSVGIEVQVPTELTPGTTTVIVTTKAGSSPAFPITLDMYSPGLLPGVNIPRLSNPSSGCYSRAASPGDAVTVYATGLGPTNPPVPTGAAAPAEPAATTVVKPVVTVGGKVVELLDSSLSPGSAGQYSVTFRAPAMTGLLGVTVSIGGQTSNTVPLPIGGTYTSSTFLTVGAATWLPGPAAPGSLMVGYSCFPAALSNAGLEGIAGDPRNPPLTLDETTVKVRDSAGIERPAPTLFVSASQVNYLIPPETATGTAIVTITSPTGTWSAGIDVVPVAPGIFQGALIQRYNNGVASTATLNLLVSVAAGIGGPGSPPVDLGSADDDVYLILFGTGLRFPGSSNDVRVTFGGTNVPVEYVGEQKEFAGLDQLNLKLPKSVAGRSGPLIITINGSASNLAYLSF